MARCGVWLLHSIAPTTNEHASCVTCSCKLLRDGETLYYRKGADLQRNNNHHNPAEQKPTDCNVGLTVARLLSLQAPPQVIITSQRWFSQLQHPELNRQSSPVHSGRVPNVPNSESVKQEHRAPKTRLASNKPQAHGDPEPPTRFSHNVVRMDPQAQPPPPPPLSKPFSIRGIACSLRIGQDTARQAKPRHLHT